MMFSEREEVFGLPGKESSGSRCNFLRYFSLCRSSYLAGMRIQFYQSKCSHLLLPSPSANFCQSGTVHNLWVQVLNALLHFRNVSISFIIFKVNWFLFSFLLNSQNKETWIHRQFFIKSKNILLK